MPEDAERTYDWRKYHHQSNDETAYSNFA